MKVSVEAPFGHGGPRSYLAGKFRISRTSKRKFKGRHLYQWKNHTITK